MLTYILALTVIIASAGLYSATFVLPEVSRKNDLAWSGVGLFYGLVLWVCAGRITGGVLLGQMASVGLIGWLGWQLIESRWNETPEGQRVNTGKVKGWRDRLTGLTQSETATKLKNQAQGAINKAQGAVQDLGVAVETGTESAAESVKAAAAEALKRADVPLTPEDFGNPPKAEIDMTAAKPAMKSFTKPADNPLGGLFDRAKGIATGLNAPKKNKEVYVRKGRDEAAVVKPEAKPVVPASEMDDDFDFGDVEEPIAKPTSVSISADEMTAMKPTSASISADEMTAVKQSVSPEGGTEETAEAVIEKAVTVVDEFGDVIVEAVEKRIGDLS